jgi:ribulose-5-phosphate 4-epimerase/fuculose-1-phosphate aldolase
VANHFSAAISADGKTFLMNPRWRHFAAMEPEDLLLLHADAADTMDRPDAPDPSAWTIHGHIHAALPRARCVLHVHPPYATAISALADPTILPIDQNTARFHDRVAIDLEYGGLADNDAEGRRLVEVLGDKSVMMMGNHGVMVIGASVAEAFDELYYLERACQTLVLAYSTGRPLSIMPDDLARRTAKEWDPYRPSAFNHFEDLKRLLARAPLSFA